MSLVLFHEVPAGAIETLFDEQNQSLFKKIYLGKYLGILDIVYNFKQWDWYFVARVGIKMGGGEALSVGRSKNPHDIFATLHEAIEIAVLSKKTNAIALGSVDN